MSNIEPVATPLISSRRILLQGGSFEYLAAKLTAYEALDDPGERSFTLTVRGPTPEGWLQVDVPADLPLYHFHNLALWLLGLNGEEAVPERLLIVVDGPGGYWLKPCGVQGGESVLHGSHDDLRPYVYDLAGGVESQDPRLAATPMSVSLALMTQQVPLSLHQPARAPAPGGSLEFRPFILDKPGASPLMMKVLQWVFGKS